MNNKPYKLLLIDQDPIFRLGLRTLLTQFSDLLVIAEADNSTVALKILDETDRPGPITSAPVKDTIQEHAPTNELSTIRSLAILDPTLIPIGTGSLNGLQLCEELKRKHPMVSILLLSSPASSALLVSARDAGVEGYCPKGTDISEIVLAIRQVATGQTYGWDQLDQKDWLGSEELKKVGEQGSNAAREVISGTPQPSTSPSSTSQSPSVPPLRPTPLNRWLQYWQRSGLQQIDTVLVEIDQTLQIGGQPWFAREILMGRQRELQTARWLVLRLLPSVQGHVVEESPVLGYSAPPTGSRDPASNPERSHPDAIVVNPLSRVDSALQRSHSTDIDHRQLQAMLLDAAVQHLQSGLTNLTDAPLEIDILQSDVKRQLLYLVLRKLESILDDLRFSEVDPERLITSRTQILQDLWQTVIADFFGKYRAVQVGAQQMQLVDTLLAEVDTVQASILSKIPCVEELLAHLLFVSPLTIDQMTYPAGSPDAVLRAGLLLDNLIIQLANAVIQPLLNRFASVEIIKHDFYDRRLLSTREIERFRNDLSWKYRLEQYVGEPTAIFQSQFPVLVLSDRGIKKTTIYANRDLELAVLQGIPAIVTLTLELRDAVAPRVKAAVAFVGSGLVYLLTDVIGRSLGLIGRGVLKGIGNAFQDLKSKEKTRSNG